MEKFETGKAYTLFDSNSSARFKGVVVKRTKGTVTFEMREGGYIWCFGLFHEDQWKPVTLRVNAKDSHSYQTEIVRGTAGSRKFYAFAEER